MRNRVLTSLFVGYIGALSIFAVGVHADTLENTSTLEGTTWEISDSNHQAYVFEFMAGSKLQYVAANGTAGRGSWKQTNDTVAFDINGRAFPNPRADTDPRATPPRTSASRTAAARSYDISSARAPDISM